MKIKDGFTLRDVCGEKVIIAEGLQNLNFSKLINLNESAAYIWTSLLEKSDFTAETVADLLCQEYEVDHTTALNDAQDLLIEWQEQGLIVIEWQEQGLIE